MTNLEDVAQEWVALDGLRDYIVGFSSRKGLFLRYGCKEQSALQQEAALHAVSPSSVHALGLQNVQDWQTTQNLLQQFGGLERSRGRIHREGR